MTDIILPRWSTACPDWEQRIVARQPLITFPPLFECEAEAALAVFDDLRIVDAPGRPTMRETARPWVRDFVGALFGSYDPEAGRRMITEFFLLISKKNTKSTTAAAIMLTALVRNWRESGEFLILAPTIEVANNSYFPVRDMIRADDNLAALLHVQDHIRTVTHRTTNATLKVVAADDESVGGKKAIGVLIDELWLFGKRHNAENMLREATGGLASRPEGFTVFLSTQSDESPAGVFKQKLDYARGVRDGRIEDPQLLPVLYEFPDAMLQAQQHLEPQNFYVTNPNLGLTVDERFLLRELAKAREGGESSMRGFLAKHLNVQVGLNLKSSAWVGAEHWEKNGEPLGLPLEELLERSEVVVIGIDGGGLDDFLGLAVLGRETGTGRWLLWTHAWVHESVLEKRKQEAPRFLDFVKEGSLTLVSNIGEDISELGEVVAQVESSDLLDRLGVDQAGIGAVVDEIVARDIAHERVVGIPQGWKLVGAIKTAERKLAQGYIRHSGSGLMAWCVGNAKPVARGNAIVIEKATAGSGKIDPLMATFNAISLMALNPKQKRKRNQLFFA